MQRVQSMFVALAIAGACPSQLIKITGLPGERIGLQVAGAGDVNRDGYADIAFSVSKLSNGEVRVVSGKDKTTLYTFRGDSANDYLGLSLSAAGDVNNDGYPDLIAGAIGDDNNGFESGSARVFSGKDGKVLFTVHGDSASDFFGWSVSGAGDVNKDGYADVIIGTLSFPRAYARVVSGKDAKTLYTFRDPTPTFSGFAWAVSGAGDVNNDGYSDLIVGVPYQLSNSLSAGYARVFSGKDGTTLHTFYGVGEQTLGYSVSSAGDIDKDGYADLVVGGPSANTPHAKSGVAIVYSGKSGQALHTFGGTIAREFLGDPVRGVGDVDGDGYPDVLIGSATDGLRADGKVTLFSGKDGSILRAITGTQRGRLGYSVAAAGDVNKDGVIDLLVGEPFANGNAGALYVFTGRIPPRASFKAFGAGCPGKSTAPRVTGSRPFLASKFTIKVSNMSPLLPGFLIFGLSDKTWRNQALPLELSFMGMPSCLLLTSWDWETVLTSRFTTAEWNGQVPNKKSLSGFQFFVQYWGWRINANPANVAVSNGVKFVLGT